MTRDRPRTVNWGIDVYDSKSMLEVYGQIIEGHQIIPYVDCRRLELTDLMQGDRIAWGFKKELLPDFVKQLYLSENETKVVVMCSYPHNQDFERSYWETRGYHAEPENKSIKILDGKGEWLATYAIKKLTVNRFRLEEFVNNMR
jgi:hypothetical protein